MLADRWKKASGICQIGNLFSRKSTEFEEERREDRNFETEGEAIESGLRRTVQGRGMMMRSLIQAVCRFRDATLVAEKQGRLW
jgi:hypothetical protein